MHILLVNDDGINSPGLHALAQEALDKGHMVTVCAPNRQQSAVSQALTLFKPIAVKPVDVKGAQGYAVDGTPADCARLGILHLSPNKVDIVLSGINDGINAGTAIYCSGTVGAAREAALLGVKSIAVSIGRPASEEMIRHLAQMAIAMAEKLYKYPAPSGSVLNLNAPALAPDKLLQPVMAYISHALFINVYEQRQSPWGDPYFWVTQEYRQEAPQPGSDEYFLQKGNVTCTFLLHPPENSSNCLNFLQDD